MPFRDDFYWGCATSAHQIEGAAFEDGKGLSVWDRFSHTPGKILEDHTADVACDHYHRMEEDVRLMGELGMQAYRFSVCWPRILPEGTGKINRRGLDFYSRLIDALLERGIRPIITLHHWDYPQALADKGGWLNPDSPRWFADFAALCAGSFGDRARDFITINEPQCLIALGYGNGAHAPGLRLPCSFTVPMSHNVLLAHGLAVQALRANAKGCLVGYAPTGNACIPATETDEDIEAARKAYFSTPDGDLWAFTSAWWSDPVVLGRYPADGLEHFVQYLPARWQDDLPAIAQKLDFYCQNIYNGTLVRKADSEAGYEIVRKPAGTPQTAMGWYVMPQALYWGPKFLYERYRLPFVISENGMADTDTVCLDGKVHDPSRIDYMHRYLAAYRRAAESGVDARGYLAWSFMDNFEWSDGYSRRFGLVYVDYRTQQRIPKDSALWYRDVIAHNGANL